ncbi:MAG: RNA polymerase sigma-54 factor [Thiotrichales bacterium SG8_50]|nr:MAG: RNA polymerase sigma-54 factor [Thiotrichales bacterium SG8_50]
MKQSLELKLGQHLTITPQLQQAIRLLQLSSLELQQEIQEALESNPLLEETEDEGNKSESNDGENQSGDEVIRATDTEMEDGAPNGDPETDQEWSDPFDLPVAPASRNDNSGELPDIDSRNSPEQTLQDHLIWQMQMTPFSNRDREIAMTIIDAIDDDGYLKSPLKDLCDTLSEDDDEVEVDEIEAVLHQIQNFDPLGVGARNLAECLRLQMRILDPDTPHLEHARAMATEENLALLASRDHTQLRKNLKLRQEDLQGAVQLIHQLNPRPGSGVNAPQASYVIPDIIVKKVKGIWRAELNGEVSPRLQIHKQYEKLIERGKNSADNKYLQEQLQQAKWFLKSLHSRNDTLVKVARQIIDRQRAFFDHGPEAMKPLVLHDIAEAVEMHESTISRVTTNKYMLTPRGVFELKYFFSSHVGTADGGTCSATAIRSLIGKIIEAESVDKPISDSKIAQMLGDQGINVARRTIAKYRESMNIPPSNLRKSLV